MNSTQFQFTHLLTTWELFRLDGPGMQIAIIIWYQHYIDQNGFYGMIIQWEHSSRYLGEANFTPAITTGREMINEHDLRNIRFMIDMDVHDPMVVVYELRGGYLQLLN